MAEKSNMTMKVVIGIVIVVVLVLLFRGMNKGTAPAPQQNGQPSGEAAPNAAPGTPGTPNAPNAPGTPSAVPSLPATSEVRQISSAGLTIVDNVRCDLSAKTVTFKFTNTEDKKLMIHTGELMQLQQNSEVNFVRLAVNGRWANPNWDRPIDCKGKMEFAPGESVECTMGGLVLRAPVQSEVLTGMSGINMLTATNLNSAYNSYNDIEQFQCQ